MPSNQNLTIRQDQVLLFFKQYCLENGRPPTIQEICNHFAWSSKNSAVCHLKSLVKKGKLRKSPGIARGYSLV